MKNAFSSLYWWGFAGIVFVVGFVGIRHQQRKRWKADVARLNNRQAEQKPDLDDALDLLKVSIVVAAWNEAPTIASFLNSYASLRYSDKELLLCIGGEDNGYDLACEWSGEGITILRQHADDTKLSALQRCLPHVTGDVLYLTDADCRLDDACFESLLTPIAYGGETITSGLFRPFPEERFLPFVRQQWATMIYEGLTGSETYIANHSGHNAMMRREVADILTTDRPVPIGEDIYCSMRAAEAGHRIRSVRESAIQTEVPLDIASYIRRQSRWVRSLLWIAIRFRRWDLVRHVLTAATIGAIMLISPLLVLALGPLGLALGAIGWIWAAQSRVRYFRLLNLHEAEEADLNFVVLVQLMVADFFVWATTPLTLFYPKLRDSW